MVYIEVIITIEEPLREVLLADLIQLNFESFAEDTNALHAFIPENHWNKTLYNKIVKRLHHYKAQGVVETFRLEVNRIEPQNWQEQWEKTIEPLRVGKNIVIHPSWTQTSVQNGIIELIIDPKMSFGTGHHETTQMMIEKIEDLMQPGMSVLDVGTGTGVLAILAAKLGASYVAAIDNDIDAFNNAVENCALNGVSGIVQVFHGELGDIPEIRWRKFDLVLVNIERTIIIQLFSQLYDLTRDQGMILFSGLIEDDLQHIVRACDEKKLSILTTTQRKSRTADTWLTLVTQK